MYCMFFYAFALAGRGVSMFDSRGAAALCPGLCACCMNALWMDAPRWGAFCTYDNVV